MECRMPSVGVPEPREGKGVSCASVKSWLGAGTEPVSCSFRIVGCCSSWCEHRTVRTTVPEPDVGVAGLKRSAKSDEK